MPSSLEIQPKLLRLLQEKTFERVGDPRERQANVRVIAATNRDLAEAVAHGSFRSDLYYRLNVVRVSLIPLRTRRQDIPALVDHLLRRTARALGAPERRVSPAAMAALMRHDWPGNVRELGNVIQRAYVLGDDETIEPDDLPAEVLRGAPAPAGREQFPTLQQAICGHVERALDAAEGDRSRAARLLGIDRKSLWRMIRRYDLSDRPARQSDSVHARHDA